MTLTSLTELWRPSRPATHVHYHEVEARTNEELGEQLGELFGDMTAICLEDARARKGWKAKCAAARPLLEATATHFPNYVVELRAFASAAGLNFEELWTLCVEVDLDASRTERCTTMVTNGGTLISHNEDFSEDAADFICIVRKKLPFLEILELVYYDCPLGGNAISVNSNGFVQCINSLNHSDSGSGLPRNIVSRWLSETRNAYSDFIKMSNLDRAGGYNHVLVDDRGVIYDIECSATRQIMCLPQSPFVHTNHFTSPDMKKFEDSARRDDTYARYARASRLISGRMSLAELAAAGGDEKDGRRKSIFNRNTVARVIVDMKAALARIWLRREAGLGWVDYPVALSD